MEEKTTLLQRYLNRSKIIRRETVQIESPGNPYKHLSGYLVIRNFERAVRNMNVFNLFFINLTDHVVPQKMLAGGYPMISFLALADRGSDIMSTFNCI